VSQPERGVTASPEITTSPSSAFGVSKKTAEFLIDAVSSGAHETLEVRKRNLVGIYFGTEASIADLTVIAGVSSREGVRQLILSGMKKLWQNLPPTLQEKYRPEEIIKLKTGFSPKARAKIGKTSKERWKDAKYRVKMSEISKGRKSPMAGKRRSLETRARISAAQKGEKNPMYGKSPSSETRAKMSETRKKLWQNPEFRVKMIKAYRKK